MDLGPWSGQGALYATKDSYVPKSMEWKRCLSREKILAHKKNPIAARPLSGLDVLVDPLSWHPMTL